MAAKKKLFIVLLTIAFISVGLYAWGNLNMYMQQKVKITRYINFVFNTMLEEPTEYHLKEEKSDEGLYIYHLDISNWDMEKSLAFFPEDLDDIKKDELLDYCEALRFSKDGISIISGLLDKFDFNSSIIKELTKNPNPKTTMIIVYDEKTEECLLIASVFLR